MDELTKVRTYGLNMPFLSEQQALLDVARRLGGDGTDRERVEAVLMLAISDYSDPRDRDIALLWFGLHPDTRGKSATERAKRAADPWEGQRAASTVRTKDAPRVIAFLARRLLARYEEAAIESPAAPQEEAGTPEQPAGPAVISSTEPREDDPEQSERPVDTSPPVPLSEWLIARWKWAAVTVITVVATAAVTGLILSGVLGGQDAPAGTSNRPPVAGPMWGPRRPLFTWDKPATMTTFNSITNNPYVGDERRFFTVVPPGTTTGRHVLKVDNHETVVVRAFFENDVASNLYHYAHQTKMRFRLPEKAALNQTVRAEISAIGVRPRMVWSSVQLYAAKPFRVSYLLGTAKLWNNTKPIEAGADGGISLTDYLVIADGAYLGCGHKLNGEVSGDVGNCSGWVTARLLIKFV